MISGKANYDGTKSYVESFKLKNKKCKNVYCLSALGIGTYLGNPNSDVDKILKEAISFSIKNGINIIDTAINYRGMRSEVIVGKVINQLIEEKKIKRANIVISTKGGFLPADYRDKELDETYRENYKDEVIDTFYNLFESKLDIPKSKINEMLDRRNVIENEIIDVLFEQSRKNLGIDTIDIYYLHNPEVSKGFMDNDLFYEELRKTFALLESKIKDNKLSYYGISTSQGFLLDANHKAFLNLEKLIRLSNEVSDGNSHLKFIQLPFNKGRIDAIIKQNQPYNTKTFSTLEVANKLNIFSISNVSLGQGEFFDKYTPQEMIKFLIENQKICSSMVGMKSMSNIEKNLNAMNINSTCTFCE